MDSERWRQIKPIFEKALEISTALRFAFLEKSCNGDEDLRREIENLLEFEETENDPLEQEAFSAVWENDTFAKNLDGKQIGNYKITGELGIGEMGAVFLATRAAGTTWQAVRAERMCNIAEIEREKAERRSENLRKISNSLVGEIERAIRDLPGSLPARQILLVRAVEQLDALALESDGNVDLQMELVWAYQNLAALPDKKLSESHTIFRKALNLTEKILASGNADIKARDRLEMLYLNMINNSRLRDDAKFTLEHNTKAVEIVEQILRDAPEEAEYQDSFWTANYHYASTMQ